MFNHRKSRPYTTALMDAVDEGVLNKGQLINDLLGYMSEADVENFVRTNNMAEYLGLEDAE